MFTYSPQVIPYGNTLLYILELYNFYFILYKLRPPPWSFCLPIINTNIPHGFEASSLPRHSCHTPPPMSSCLPKGDTPSSGIDPGRGPLLQLTGTSAPLFLVQHPWRAHGGPRTVLPTDGVRGLSCPKHGRGALHTPLPRPFSGFQGGIPGKPLPQAPRGLSLPGPRLVDQLLQLWGERSDYPEQLIVLYPNYLYTSGLGG